ncbi:MAG: DUF2034 domain-containing protein [Zoogloeaceae bacterium]|nr:DUF2034 domain-containing protein [Rhodocyclaceae bacterium]MCP5252907.1 DUF2034 domain-containing protein [Zoogloeaceae bacterium]MCP5293173.1 DUF2034 domain-containing protein [Zoogloeaceae bacterium]MCW5617575.1 DUF2034 domain-containing protein [Rhodocyclaceae bacterium]
MARRRKRKNEAFLELAFRSDWRLSVALAAGTAFIGLVLVPIFLAQSPILRPLGSMLTMLCWLFTVVFAAIAMVRYLKQRQVASAAIPQQRAASAPRSPRSGRPPWAANEDSARSDGALAQALPSPFAPAPPRPDAWSLDVLDRVEWKRFEDLCCAFYVEKGIRAEVTRLGADGGIDVHLFQDDTEPARATAIVQCKAWNQQVGVKPVRELRGVMAHEKVDKAFFMAPQGFTDDARAFAAENRITLLDGKLFLAMLQRLPAESNRRLLELATEGDWTTPTCPSCGTKMVARDSKRGAFWGCPTYPKCRGKLAMRATRKQTQPIAA